MALRVWLPLNGNLENQGLSDYSLKTMGTGIVFNTNGKIGKSVTFPNSPASCLYIDGGLKMQNLTWACWFKSLGAGSGTSQRILSEGRDTGNRGVEIWLSKDGLTLNAFARGKGFSASTTINTWHHVALVAGDAEVSLYLDGTLINTAFPGAANDYAQSSDAFVIGKMSYLYTATTNYFPFNGYMNDVRVYDECLSQKQIKEISKGLVAHYKLDSQFRSNRNVILGYYGTNSNSGWGAHRGTAVYTNDEDNSGLPFKKITKFTVTYDTSLGSGGGTSVYPPMTYNIAGGTQYTYSTYIKSEDNLTYMNANFLYRYEYDANGTKLTENGVCSSTRKEIIGNGWYRIWGTFTTQADTTKITLPFYTYCGKNNVYYLGGQQLELGDTMTPYIDNSYSLIDYEVDSSGNGYNGAVAGTISYNPDSARYSGSAQFSSSYINSSAGGVLANSKDFTINGWFYRTGSASITYYASAENYNTSIDLEGSRYFVYGSNGVAYVGNWTSTANIWQMITLVHNSIAKTLSLYVNGNYISQVATTGDVYANNTLNIGGRQNVASFAGSISDFRIYATALSADEILTMYKNSGIIDNKGNVYAYEFKEE